LVGKGLREEHGLNIFQKRMLIRIFETVREDVMRG
jgi:hypothetical protein